MTFKNNALRARQRGLGTLPAPLHQLSVFKLTCWFGDPNYDVLLIVKCVSLNGASEVGASKFFLVS